MSNFKSNNSKNTQVISTFETILYILKKKVNVGSAVYIVSDNVISEGIIDKIDFEGGYLTLNTATAITYIKLSELIYIQVLEVNLDKCNKKYKTKSDNVILQVEDVTLNIWSNINIGDRMLVNIKNKVDRFAAVVEEINFNRRYVGLRTVSGITYVPLNNIVSIFTCNGL